MYIYIYGIGASDPKPYKIAREVARPAQDHTKHYRCSETSSKPYKIAREAARPAKTSPRHNTTDAARSAANQTK